jgi:dolichol-phosphate mannosyltransferase
MAASDTYISIVAPLHNAGHYVAPFVREMHALLSAEYNYFEIVLVDDASTDDTIERLQPLLAELVGLRLIRLSRRMGMEIAITAGLEAAIGDFVGVMDPNFDPPAVMIDMLGRARDGIDVLQGTAVVSARAGLAYCFARRTFYSLAQGLLKLELLPGATALRVMSRQAVNAMTKHRSRQRYFALLAADVGFIRAVHPYQTISRSGAGRAMTWLEATRLALSIIVHSSIRPLRMVSAVAVLGSLAILGYILYVVYIFLTKDDVLPGWTTLSLEVSGLFFLLFVMIALIGEYLGRLIDETTDRPLYHLRSEQASSVMLLDPSRLNVEENAAGGTSPTTKSA